MIAFHLLHDRRSLAQQDAVAEGGGDQNPDEGSASKDIADVDGYDGDDESTEGTPLRSGSLSYFRRVPVGVAGACLLPREARRFSSSEREQKRRSPMLRASKRSWEQVNSRRSRKRLTRGPMTRMPSFPPSTISSAVPRVRLPCPGLHNFAPAPRFSELVRATIQAKCGGVQHLRHQALQ